MPKLSLERLQGALGGFAGSEGLAGIEFALLVPVLLMLLICTIDLGMVAYDEMQVENAAQAGSEYAAVHGFNSSSIASVITSATSLSGITASPAPSQTCGCPSSSSVATATCNSTCSDGSIAGLYVTATATATYTTLIHYPMLPQTITISNAATARIQ